MAASTGNDPETLLLASLGISPLSIFAALIYALVMAACLAAMMTAKSTGQRASHLRGWLMIALLFAVLIALRALNVEEDLRYELRDWARSEDTYSDRQGWQLPLTLAIIVMAGMAAFGWAFRSLRMTRGRRNFAFLMAQIGAGAMVLLIALRMISFSTLDKLLYGPLKLNWVGDLGSAALVAGCALYYVYVVRQSRGGSPR